MNTITDKQMNIKNVGKTVTGNAFACQTRSPNKSTLIAGLVLLLALTSCSSMTTRNKNTAVGAGVGAVAGAVLTGGSAWGTVGGAAVGGVIGNQVGKHK